MANLATFRGWAADNPGCIDALRKYAALRAAETDGFEDAVEAEAMAMFLASDPLGDRLKMFNLVWTVKDVEKAQEAMLSAPRLRPLPFDPAQLGNAESPPPKAVYMLLDRPMPESADGLSVDNIPRLLGQALLFGRQTDREARLEVMGVAADEAPVVVALLREVAGEALAAQAKQEVVGEWSASQKLLRTAWQPPRGALPEQIRALVGAVPEGGGFPSLARSEAGRARRPLAARRGRRPGQPGASIGGHHGAGTLGGADARPVRLQ